MSKHDDYYTKFAIYGNNDSLETLKKRLCSTFVGSFGSPASVYNVPLVKTQMKKIIVTAKTLYSHPKNVSKIYAALHTDLAW